MAVLATAVHHQELASAATHDGAEKAPLPAFQVFWKPAHTNRLFQASPGWRLQVDTGSSKEKQMVHEDQQTEHPLVLPHQSACSLESVSCHKGSDSFKAREGQMGMPGSLRNLY